jgi:hypothetical protein
MLYWDDALRIALSARWPERGKPLEPNTRMILDGPRDKPEQVRLRYHSTDIIVWKPNGDWYVCTGWDTVTTKARLRAYGGVSVYQANLPALNGYSVSPERSTFMSLYNGYQSVPFDGNASPTPDAWGHRHNYIRIRGRCEIDLSTVNAVQVQCVVEPEKLRRRMRHIGKIARFALGYAKLDGRDGVFEKGEGRVSDWLLARMNTPLEETQLSPFPFIGHQQNPKTAFKQGMDSIRWTIAHNEGWLGSASLLKVPLKHSNSN